MNPFLFNVTQKSLIAKKVRTCNRIWSRMIGFLSVRKPVADEACWLIPCHGIQTVGMAYPIDAYFLNKNNEIVAIEKNLQPNRFSKIYLNAHSVLEFASGPERDCRLGDKISLEVGRGT